MPHTPPVRISLWALQRANVTQAASPNLGQYGGSQIGMRATIPLENLPQDLALSVRVSSDTPRLQSAEAALGLSYHPLRDVALDVIAEGRVMLSQARPVQPAILVAGGWHQSDRDSGRIFQGYVQTGIVGAHHPLGFADGGMTLRWSVSRRAAIGAGIWGGAQPGAMRLDIGPSLQMTFHGTSLALDWRVRIAGNAPPHSGPSLTLGKDF